MSDGRGGALLRSSRRCPHPWPLPPTRGPEPSSPREPVRHFLLPGSCSTAAVAPPRLGGCCWCVCARVCVRRLRAEVCVCVSEMEHLGFFFLMISGFYFNAFSCSFVFSSNKLTVFECLLFYSILFPLVSAPLLPLPPPPPPGQLQKSAVPVVDFFL